mgnify:FL=1
MICLDTNDLILGLVPGSHESTDLIAWAQAEETPIVQKTADTSADK